MLIRLVTTSSQTLALVSVSPPPVEALPVDHDGPAAPRRGCPDVLTHRVALISCHRVVRRRLLDLTSSPGKLGSHVPGLQAARYRLLRLSRRSARTAGGRETAAHVAHPTWLPTAHAGAFTSLSGLHDEHLRSSRTSGSIRLTGAVHDICRSCRWRSRRAYPPRGLPGVRRLPARTRGPSCSSSASCILRRHEV